LRITDVKADFRLRSIGLLTSSSLGIKNLTYLHVPEEDGVMGLGFSRTRGNLHIYSCEILKDRDGGGVDGTPMSLRRDA